MRASSGPANTPGGSGVVTPVSPVMYEEPEQAASSIEKNVQGTTGKKGRGVRFQTDDGDIIQPEKVNRFERPSTRTKAAEALDYLLAGNRRFQAGKLERCIGGPDIVAETAEDVAKPSTIILSCSDSRVPPEIVCDMGLGDCHVVRVGGNVVNDFILGSIIFAVENLQCPLVVVLAHSRCSVVASAVQKWARVQSSKHEPSRVHDDREARSLAETVQKTLGLSPNVSQKTGHEGFAGTPQSASNPADSASSHPPLSPFQEAAISQKTNTHAQEPGFFEKCCSCFSTPESRGTEPHGTVSGASTPMRTKGEGIQDTGRGQSLDGNRRGSSVERRGQSMGRDSNRNFIRQSINPLNALVGAIGGVVESMASSGQHETLKNIVKKESQQKDKGYDSDDEDLKRGLQKADSLEFTRARLAKSRQEKRMDALRRLSERDDVDCIIDENAKVSANTILKGIVKNLDLEVVKNVEVVAAKYDINDGAVKVLSRNWYSVQQHTFYSTPH